MYRLHSMSLIAAALLAPAAASAQAALKPAVGISFSDVSKDPATGSANGKVGWQLGGTILLGQKLYFESGAFYVRRSTEITTTDGANTVDFDGISGLRVPAVVGYHLLGQEESPFGLRVFGGASVFIVTSVDATGLGKSDFESPTWAVLAGAGLDFLFLFADLQYEWSLTDLSKVSTVDVGKSRSLTLSAGVKIPL